MKKTTRFLAVLATISLSYSSAFSAEQSNDFIESLKGEFRETKNQKGFHFPDLGPIQEEFYNFCTALDQNTNVKNPVVLLIGEAYGLRAAEVINKTKRVTVVLNDLGEKHFDGIKRWAQKNGVENRLILAPGNFFNIDQSLPIKKFFGGNLFKFNSILAANVFHHLSPVEFIKGLGFIADHLLPNGDAFFTSALTQYSDASRESDEAIASTLLRIGQAAKFEGRLASVVNMHGVDKINSLMNYAQERQEYILWNFNKKQGVMFPAYLRLTDGVLDPSLIFDGESYLPAKMESQYLPTTPEELAQYSKTVGLIYSPIKSSVIEGGPFKVSYYSARLSQSISPLSSTERSMSNNPYSELIKQASNIDNELKKVHEGKIFRIENTRPHFGIRDLKTHQSFSSLASEVQKVVSDQQTLDRLWNKLFSGIFNGDDVHSLGGFFLKLGNYELAAAVFNMGVDMGHQPSLCMLDVMIEAGRHPYKKARGEDTPKSAS